MAGFLPPLCCAFLSLVVTSAPEQIIPIENGMTWQYSMTEEAGPGVRLADEAAHEAGTLHSTVMYHLEGTRELDGKSLLQFEMHRGGRITNTDLLTIDEKGIQCLARIDDSGQLTRLNPPQPIVATPVAVGTYWDFDTQVAGEQVHQHYEIVGQADVTTPAGTFHAFHIRGEQTTGGKMIIDRWFVPGVGIVKDATETRSESGELLRRTSLELTEKPKVAARPDLKVRPGANKLSVSAGQEAVGESRTIFSSATAKICARWQGHGLRVGSKVRALWIAEEVKDVAPPDYTIDEATTSVTAPDSHGVFILGRPEDGWAAGIYRVEFYIDGAFADALKLKIVQSDATKF